MSSLTISMALCSECQPFASKVGAKARTFGVLAGRWATKLQVESTAPSRFSVSRSSMSSGGTCA